MNQYYTQITEIEKEIDQKHTTILSQTKNQAEIDGKSDIPNVDIEGISPSEFSINANYQGIIYELAAKGGQILQAQKVEVEHIGSDLNYLSKNPESITHQLNEAESNKNQKLQSAREAHQINVTRIWQKPSYLQIRKDFDEIKDKYDSFSQKLGRSSPHQIGNLYWGLLILVGLSELAYNFQAFSLALSESPFLTLVAALSVVVIFPVLAHFAGKIFRQYEERKKDIWLGILCVIISIGLTYVLAKWRVRLGVVSGDIEGSKQANEAFNLYFLLIFAIYFVGLILSFFAHDQSQEFTNLYNDLGKKRKIMDSENNDINKEINAEQNRNTEIQKTINNEFQNIKSELNNRLQSLNKMYKDAVANYKKSVEYFHNIELKINANYKQCINDYRVINLKYRLHKQVPKSWDNQPKDLELHFDKNNNTEFTI